MNCSACQTNREFLTMELLKSVNVPRFSCRQAIVAPERQTAPFLQMSLRKDILRLSGILVAQRESSLREDNGGGGTLELLARTNNFPRWQVV